MLIINFLSNICIGSGISCLLKTENIMTFTPIIQIFTLCISYFISAKLFSILIGFYISLPFEVSGGFTAGVLFALGTYQNNFPKKTNQYKFVSKLNKLIYLYGIILFAFLSSLFLYMMNYDLHIACLNQKWLFDLAVALVVLVSTKTMMEHKC